MSADNNNREQNSPASSNQDSLQNQSRQGQRQDTSRQEQEGRNPQEGSEWNNYRTRELGGNKENQEQAPVQNNDE